MAECVRPNAAPVDQPRHVAVVGGGAAGVIAAIHLLRGGNDKLVVTVYEPRPVLGGGVAYSSDNPVHRVNVPAARMSVFADDPDHFHRWAIARGIIERDGEAQVETALFPQRGWFGRYLNDLLDETAALSPAKLRIVHEAVVAVTAQSGGFFVRSNGHASMADALVIATGNPTPDVPAVLGPNTQDSRLIADPLLAGTLSAIPASDAVLIVGTGLTMADTVASLVRQGHSGQIIALSRHGLLPRKGSVTPFDPADLFALEPPTTALSLLRAFRALAKSRDLSQVVDSARRAAPDLWAALPLSEKQRLLRHLRVFWETRRFVMAPQIATALEHAFEGGNLHVLAARLLGATPHAEGVDVAVRHRRSGAAEQMTVQWVINATGPALSRAIAKSPLLGTLQAQGLIEPDPLRFGLATDRAGRASDNVFVVGPLARGARGELSGIREISAHAHGVAAQIIQNFQADAEASLPRAD